MKFCDKLLYLRKKQGLSQEQLADLLGISRQSVSKWESGQAMPELAKLIQMADLFSVPVDDLVRDDREFGSAAVFSGDWGQPAGSLTHGGQWEPGIGSEVRVGSETGVGSDAELETEKRISDEELRKNLEEMKDSIHQISKSVTIPAGFEYKSRITICGIPLVHIHFSKLFRAGVFQYNRTCVAKGIFAAGDMAVGVVSLGAFSFGILPIGGIAVGLLSVGVVSVGVIALGITAIGIYAAGAAALGVRAAAGISVSARTAVGTSEVQGLYRMIPGTEHSTAAVQDFFLTHTPEMPRWLARFLACFV